MKPSYNLENKTSSDTYWRVKLVCKKVQAHSSWEPPLEYNQDQPDAFGKSKFIMAFLTILGLTEILCSFRLVLEGKICKEIPESSRLKFLEPFSANNFASSDAEDKTSGGIADLPLLRTLLAIRPKSLEPSFWEVMDSSTLLLYGRLASSRTLLQRLLACLNFTLDLEDLTFWYKQKKWFLFTMPIVQAAESHGDGWDLTWYFYEGYIHQFQPEPTHKIH